MELVKPEIGLIFWMTITFSIVLYILSKYAWKPIMKSIREREDSINNSLNAAEEARRQMENLKADNERLLQQAREERDMILKEASSMKDSIIAKAQKEGDEMKKKLVVEATEAIKREKNLALAELKNQVAALSIDIAEKILRKTVEKTGEQESMINESLKNLNLN